MGGVGHCPVERMNIEPAVKGTEIKAAYWSKKPSEAQEKTMKWYETEATNGDSLGLRDGRENHFDTTEVNARLVEAGL